MKNSLYTKAATGALGIMMMAAPLATFAATTTPAVTGGAGVNFCTNVNAAGSKIIAGIDTKTGTIDSKKATRIAKLSEARQKRDETVTTKRAERDTALDMHYTSLMKKADTDAKKAAVSVFKTSTDAAIKARRDAIDAAIKTYRSGIDTLISQKFGTLDTDRAALKTAADAALAKAKSSCTAGTDSNTVRASFKADIKAARDAYKATHTQVSIKADIKVLSAARKTSVEEAIAKFKTDMTAARTTLKTALGSK